MLPFKGRNRVTQIFSSTHGGIDIVGDDSTQIRSLTSGTVDMVQIWDKKTKTGSQSYGNLVRVLSDDGKYIYYAHLSQINVAKGQCLHCGDIIGIMGNSGNSFGAHLHLEVRTGKSTATRISPSCICSVKNAKETFFENESESKAQTAVTQNTQSGKIKASAAIKLENVGLYVSASALTPAAKKSGTFYVYDANIINGKIRITCNKSYVGKKPVGKYVTGWINVSDVNV